MQKLKFIILCFFASAGFCFGNQPNNDNRPKSSKPNIIIILTDDQGYHDLGVYGANDFETPNIDKLASGGVRFTDYYNASSVCSPSRAATLTGCYPVRVGIANVLFPYDTHGHAGLIDVGLNQSEQTIPKLLKANGYRTSCIGKWHLGDRPQFLPLQNGFDEYYGLPYSNDMRPETDPDYRPLPLIRGNKTIEVNPDQSTLTTRYTNEAVQFINRNKENPFFLYLAHSMPHAPLYVSDKFKGKSKNGLYGDVMMEIDWSVGEIVKNLKTNGIYENTVIIFTSDNGPWLVYGNHGGSAKPLREGKNTSFDGGHRVPFIVSWPGKISPNRVSSTLVSNIDLLPTIAKFTGSKLPNQKIDGKDISSILTNDRSQKAIHKYFYFYNGATLQAVRYKNWKLHFAHSYNSVKTMGMDGNRGEYYDAFLPESLFDISTDSAEVKNVFDAHPKLAKEMTQKAKKFDEELKRNARTVGKYNDGK